MVNPQLIDNAEVQLQPSEQKCGSSSRTLRAQGEAHWTALAQLRLTLNT